MSRTKHHGDDQRSCDLWSKRPNAGACKTKYNRKRTIEVERQQERKMLHNIKKDVEWPDSQS